MGCKQCSASFCLRIFSGFDVCFGKLPFVLGFCHSIIAILICVLILRCWGVCALVLAPSAYCLLVLGLVHHHCLCCDPLPGNWDSPGGFLSDFLGGQSTGRQFLLHLNQRPHCTLHSQSISIFQPQLRQQISFNNYKTKLANDFYIANNEFSNKFFNQVIYNKFYNKFAMIEQHLQPQQSSSATPKRTTPTITLHNFTITQTTFYKYQQFHTKYLSTTNRDTATTRLKRVHLFLSLHHP